MGTFTITIQAAATPAYIENSNTVTNCYSEKSITVKHNGTDKYVQIIASGYNASPNFTEIITADKTYNLLVEGNNSTGGTLDFNGNVVLRVRELSSSGQLLATVSISRNHTGDIC